MIKRTLPLILAALVLTPLAFACGDGDDNDAGSAAAGEIDQTLRAAVSAYQRGDLNAFLGLWTDDGLEAEFGATRGDIFAAGADFFGGPPLELVAIRDTEVDGDEAEATMDLAFGTALQPSRYSLIREAGAWKIDDTEPVDAAIPAGATTVDIELDEFSFEFDATDIESGNVAFKADNIGDQPHEVVIVKVPAGLTLDALLQSEDEELPPGVEPVGFAGPFGPGDDGNVVFTEPLASGRYMLLCFLPDEEDPQETPHALKGMASEFRVP